MRHLEALFRPKRTKILLEDTIKLLYKEAEEVVHQTSTPLHKQLGISEKKMRALLEQLREKRLVAPENRMLTEAGRREAHRILRHHRLYETYLSEHSGLPAQQWHERAERMEHHLDVKQADELARRLGFPQYDPHGDPIPQTDGSQIRLSQTTPIESLKQGDAVKVVHLEDEPIEHFAQLHELGLYPGAIFTIISQSPKGWKVLLEQRVVQIRHTLLGSLTLCPTKIPPHNALIRLSELPQGVLGTVYGIAGSCVGANRRRLLDLGFVRGSEVQISLRSPLGNPTAYLIRGTQIALRDDQAQHIQVLTQEKNA